MKNNDTKIIKKKKNTKKKEKALVKKCTKQDIIKMTEEQGIYELHPVQVYKKISENIEKFRSEEEDPKYMENVVKDITKVNDFSHTHLNLANTVPEKMVTSVVEIANNLIEEYECNTTLEKTLCEVVANSYGKVLSISRRLDRSLEFDYF